MRKPVVGITMGDPAGVGPELCLRALREKKVYDKCVPVVFGDASVLHRVAGICRLPLPALVLSLEEWLTLRKRPANPAIVDCKALEADSFRPGTVNAACGNASYRYVEAAVNAALTGRIAALATAPINKESLHLGGINFPGHTEILATLTGARRVCMMMASEEIKVSLVTIHTGLATVPRLITQKAITDTIELTAAVLKKLGRKSPRIGVCALNPHGGEHGLFGREERDIIEPALRLATRKGIQTTGPLIPDTAFLPERRKEMDAYVVMYHDQGLIPFKMLAFDSGVNITLGLPIVRTSVDHGTAFDIAWKGTASVNSLIQSILWAVKLA